MTGPRAFIVLALLLSGTAQAQQSSSFDGTWLVLFACPAADDGTRGYTLRYLATVQSGVLHGETGTKGQEGSLSLDGTILPDGNALLLATGLTADPAYSVGRARPLSPVKYHVQARFQGTRGTGQRIELRRCEAVFTRQ